MYDGGVLPVRRGAISHMDIEPESFADITPFILVAANDLSVTWASQAVRRRIAAAVGMSVPDIIAFREPADALTRASLKGRLRAPCSMDLLSGDSRAPLRGRWLTSQAGFIMLAAPDVKNEDDLGSFSLDDFPAECSAVDRLVTQGEARISLAEAANALNALKDANRNLKTANRELARLATIVESSEDAIISADWEGIIASWNPAAERLFGYSREEVVGKHVSLLAPPGGEGEISANLARLKKGESIQYEGRRRKKDGAPADVSVAISVIKDAEGSGIGFSGIYRDISKRKQMEASLAQSEKLAAVGQLAAGVAHEINNPLGIILGFSQSVLTRIKDDDILTMPLKSIARETLRCKDLVQNLLVFSRVQKSEQRELVDLNSALEAALSLVQAQAKMRNVELVKGPSVELPQILANKLQLQQVLINLANNAIDAMPKGGTLAVRAALSGRCPGSVEIEVRDTGHGIPKELQAKIFEPFFTTKDIGKGTGLGLALVYEIVQKHNGTIELESAEGKGTTFTVFLPMEPPTV